MFFFFGSATTGQLVVRSTLLLRQAVAAQGSAIYGGFPRTARLSYARASNGLVYMATGLGPVMKWDGQTYAVLRAGVPAPTVAPQLAITGTGDIAGTYRCYQRWLDAWGNTSNLSPVSDDVTVTRGDTVLYSSVEAPTDTRVRRRQILRNVAGSLLVFYVDVDTEDLGGTAFSSTQTDAELRDAEAVPLFDETLSVHLANRFGEPPDHKPYIAYYNNRLWLYGEVAYTEGSLTVTQGSDQVTGTGTEFDSWCLNRFLYVRGADRAYEITAVNATTQTLTLDGPYATATALFAAYSIRPAPALRHYLYYSEPTLTDGWPTFQALQVDNSDDLNDVGTGLLATQSFLYVLQKRHVHRLSFLQDPAADGGIFLACRRGCINSRCWAAVDGYVYMLDDRGIYRFDGGDKTEDLSVPIQDIFHFEHGSGKLRLNWSTAEHWFCGHERGRNVLRWHVCLSGDYQPRHAICFNYSHPQWWIEEYPHPLGGMEQVGVSQNIYAVAGPAAKVHALGTGTLDGVRPGRGDTRSTAIRSDKRRLTANGQTFPAQGLVGAPVAITEGRGRRQLRRIVAVSGQTLTLDHPWHVRPDATSAYQIGAIPWSWKSGWTGWMDSDFQQIRSVRLLFQPVQVAVTADLRLYTQYATTPTDWALDWPRGPEESSGVTTYQDDPDARLELDYDAAGVYVALDNWGRPDEVGTDNLCLELRGYSCAEAILIYQIDLEGGEE